MDLIDFELGKSNKKISKESLEQITKFRNKLLLQSNKENYFGKLIYDTKNKEYGFVVGQFDSIDPEKKGKKRRLLLVTRGDEDFRVRYTEENFVKELRDVVDTVSINTCSQNINYYCQEQCIMECSEQCALFKYKVNGDK